MSELPPWDPDLMDREIRAVRKRNRLAKPPTDQRSFGRGPASDDDLERRAAADAYLRGERIYRAKHQNRTAKPRQTRAGTWTVKFWHRHQRYHATFDTYAEALAYIQQVKES